MRKIKDLFSNFNLNLNGKFQIFIKNTVNNQSQNSEPKHELKTGKIYFIWLLILPLLIGLTLGRLADVCLGFGLEFISGKEGLTDNPVKTTQIKSKSDKKSRELNDFIAENPFHISPKKVEAPVVETPKPVEDKPPVEDKNLDDYVLRGTMPGVAAWIEGNGQVKLVLVGKAVERYRLTKVNNHDATFKRGKDTVIKYLTFGPVVKKPAQSNPNPNPNPKPNPKPAQNTDDVIAAEPNGQEGQISSERLNQLVQNPFDEMKRIRIRPNDKFGGMEVQWIQNESILKQLGVKKGDIIKSMNGIPLTNMGDIANALSSLMNGERADVEVTRGGKTTSLRYVVR